MIAYLKGTVAELAEDHLVLDVRDVGYLVYISGETFRRMPQPGETALLYTYQHVQEDVLALYGFLRRDELELFRKLLTVNGIGPKGGLGILSVLDADALRFAILTGDSKTLAKAPGIGAKTAQRLILELRDKLGQEAPLPEQPSPAGPKPSGAAAEASEALTALGYGAAEALAAVRQAETSPEMSTEELLRAALKFL